MSNTDDLNLSEEDRLPWLEAVEDDEYDSPNPLRVLGGVLAALAALGLIVGGIWWMQQRQAAGGGGEVIAAAEGPYKEKTDGNDGLKVGNESDAMQATSQGAEVGAKVDTRPDAETKPAPTTAPAAGGTVKSISGPGAIQLGAYGSAEKANGEWASLSAKFPDLAKLTKSVEPVQSGGKTVYRLRANAGNAGQASALCAKVTSGGGNCILVR